MYRVRTEFTGMQGAPWLSTMYFNDTGGTPQQAVTAVGAFWGAVDLHIDNEVDWTTLTDVETVAADSGQVVDITSTTPVTGTGASSSEALPFATQALVRWRTGDFINGREIRGRTFIPGVTELFNDNGRPIAALVSTINTAAATLIGDANSLLDVWSRQNGLARAVVTGSAWSEFAILRSRRD